MLLVFIVHSLFAQQNQKISSTHLQFNADTGKLQFAIISDLWGGNRPGIFENAVNKLEILQPQFVLSVGDLIDGKSYDPKVIAQQWDDFDSAIKPLSMPFFYVPGNHDIGNAIMEKEWQKRIGSPYYHFIFKNALFLCINTEDGGRGGIGDDQATYFKKVIAENPDVKWTFVFMHRPVWQGKNDKMEGYEKIEASLKGRNYTLFSGHHHTYLSTNKKGNKHFVLGSTGGGSDLRGEKFGEFDHVTWVTLNGGDEPKIINLKLDGMIKEDIVNEKVFPLTQTLINGDWLFPVPLVSEHQKEKNITAEILLDNPTACPLKVTGQLGAQKELSFSPSLIDITIAPHSKVVQPVLLSMKDQSELDIARLPSIDISLSGEYLYNGISYMLPTTKKLLLSWKMIPSLLKKGNKANMLHGWDTTGMTALTAPEYLERKWYWSGTEDALIQFKTIKDNKYVYIPVLVNDDQWVTGKQAQKDILYLHVEDSSGIPCFIAVSPGDKRPVIEGKGNIQLKDIGMESYFNNSSWMTVFRLPIHKIRKKDNSIRLNVGFRDQDNHPEKQFSILFWKPLWDNPTDYKNSGAYLLDQ
ncbi:MAG TPA: metallophosphoesterase [Daejeonella sp.]|nr:metallophosphoesterase [Daejeonella sp.]